MSAAAKPANGRAMTTEQPAEAGLLDRVVEATAQHRYSLDEVRYMADAAEKSGLFGLKQAQAFVLMMIAEARGLHPIEALQRYHVIHNRPSMAAKAMLAEMISRGWEVEWISEDDDEKEQAALWSHPRRRGHQEPKRIGFTREQAKKAGLDSDTWKKYPSNMLRARAISNAVGKLDPGVALGMYTPEEIADMPNEPRPAPRRFEPPPQAEPEPKPAAPPVAEPQPRGECSAWIQAHIDDTENEWAMLFETHRKPGDNLPFAHLGANGKRLTVWQAINGVVNNWLAAGTIVKGDVETDGKRDRAKVLEAIKHEWAADDDGEGLMLDITDYLRGKFEAAAAAVGINLDAQPAEESHDAEVLAV